MTAARGSLPILAAIVICLLFFPLSASAANGEPQGTGSVFHGVYAGGFAGISSLDFELDSGGDSIDGLAASGFSNSVFLGTGTVYNNVFFALEGNLGYHNADFSIDVGDYNLEADVEEEYGVNARVGGLLSESVLTYALAGWQQINIDVSDNTGFSEGEQFNGIKLGLGMEYQTTQNVFFRGEYNYTLFNEEKNIEPRMGQFQLGIGFRF